MYRWYYAYCDYYDDCGEYDSYDYCGDWDYYGDCGNCIRRDYYLNCDCGGRCTRHGCGDGCEYHDRGKGNCACCGIVDADYYDYRGKHDDVHIDCDDDCGINCDDGGDDELHDKYNDKYYDGSGGGEFDCAGGLAGGGYIHFTINGAEGDVCCGGDDEGYDGGCDDCGDD